MFHDDAGVIVVIKRRIRDKIKEVGGLGQKAEDQQKDQTGPHRHPEQDLKPAGQGVVALVQFPAKGLRVPHGGHRPLLRLLGGQRGVPLQQGVPVIFHVGGELGGNGIVVRPEADEGAHRFAEFPDGGPGSGEGLHHAMAGANPASTAFTAWEKVVHSSFFSPSRRRPFLVMW